MVLGGYYHAQKFGRGCFVNLTVNSFLLFDASLSKF